MEKNLALKKALCEKAEALKDSTDWKSITMMSRTEPPEESMDI